MLSVTTAHAAPPAFMGCDTRAFLFQGNPTSVFSIDLVTGAPSQVGTDIAASNLNGVGYNPLDNYVYGMWTTGAAIGHVIRVGSDFAVQDMGLPTGLPPASYNVGEFDNNGHYWVTSSNPGGTVYDVDMRPGSATYFSVVGSRVRIDPAGYNPPLDWAFNPVDGFLYSTPRNTTTNRLHLFRYNRSNGAYSNLGAIAGIPADATFLHGANYSDAGGFIYAGDNSSGRIYRINTATVSGSLLSTGPASGGNDGARCFNAPVPVDFGDAPDTYGTLLASNGARHSIPGYSAAAKTAPLMLGSRISAEADGQPSSDASADTFDDGLVPGSVQLLAGATTASMQVKAINAKATAATLAGWVDFDNNGTFDAGERAQVAVPANTMTATTFTLNWSGLAPIASGFSAPARLRIATTAAQVAGPTGAAGDGEVEDYVVPTTLPVFDCSTNPSLFNTSYDVANGGVLPPGSRDRNWDVGLGTPAGGPSSVTNWIDAYVTGNAVPGAWANSPFGNADWISFFSNANQGASNVDEYHRYRFTLDPAVVPSTFSLGIDFYADNSVWEVYVNGVPQSGLVAGLPQYPANPYFSAGFAAGNQAHLTLNHSWQAGTNEIVVQVKSGPGFVGFLGQVTASGLCPAEIGVTKSASPAGVLTPNGNVTYTVTVTNTGLVPAPNTVISDPLPAGLVSATWTCAGSGGAVCPNASGGMPLNQIVATFPAGGVLTYTILGTVAANPPANIANTVSATPPGNNGQCFPDDSSPPCSAT
ncbi:MAG TPA: GEVED domain-containing protein, partial [Dokdonella sp.]|nr:GEVED domain-containing protein [Dokdonella sp.]